ncbi:MAG: hypothetical protein KF789_05780 [Bdellovibrionaceae bacterium]|nr:hypothetical protein [Pseudobdellovibrionaceae bacterium]
MKLAPAKWKGSARQLINDVLKPHFLKPRQVEEWQSFLVRRLSEPDPIYVVGAPTPDLRSRWGQEKISLTHKNSRIYFGDKAPATAILTYLRSIDNPTPEKMSALFIHLPHHAFDLDKFTRWASLSNNVASAGWMTAHMLGPVGADASWENLSADELRKLALRNLHPLNMFLFPNLNKSGAVFADDPRLHALIAESYAQIYGPLWQQSLELRGDSQESFLKAEDFEIDLAAEVSVPETAKIESKDMISKIAATEAFDLKLVTVNEAQGYHSRVLDPNILSRGFFDMKLDFKEKSGDVKTIGFFRLNIKDLYEKKFIARDAKGVRLLVHRTNEGQFAVGPRKTGPLSPLP